MVSNAVTVVPPANVDLVTEGIDILVCTEIRIVNALEHIPPIEKLVTDLRSSHTAYLRLTELRSTGDYCVLL